MLRQKILDQFYKKPSLKVLFFFDPNKEFNEETESLQMDNIRVVKYENNPLNLKLKLHGEWSNEKIFLYVPFETPLKQEELKSFPLLDILVANKELKLGDVSDFMDQYGLRPQHQSLVSTYMSELKFNAAQQVLKPILNLHSFSKEALEKGLISAFLKFNEPQPWEFIIARLLLWTKQEHNEDLARAFKKIYDNRLNDLVSERFTNLLDEPIKEINKQVLEQIVKKLKYNLIVLQLETAKGDPYSALKIKHSISLNQLSIFFEQVRSHPKFGGTFVDILKTKGDEIKEEVILSYYGVDASYFWMPDALKWLVLNEYINLLSQDPSKTLQALESMSLHFEENETIKTVLNACLHAANCLKEIAAVSNYRLNMPEDYVHQYAKSDYKIDQSYRKAIFKLDAVDDMEVPRYISLDGLKEGLNTKYDTWLERINREWLSCLKTKEFDYQQLSLPKQYNFYESEVKPFDQKLVVFISDALRYEAAAELLNEMHNDRKSEAELRFMLASIPSKTSVGMSNLLPGVKRVFNNDNISIDGVHSDSTNRQAILQKANPKAIVISYEKIEKNNQEQNRELFKAPLVYIYHDVIDATGDSRKSERRTFREVETAIGEIKQMVKRIHGNYNVSRVLITADHGFLYNDRPIDEADKQDLPDADALIEHKRFVLFDKPINPTLGYFLPLKNTTLFEDDNWILIPASTNRYKKQGVTHQYVHGGASMQELIVPVIESARRREDISKKVSVKLLTTQPRIVSSILKVEVLQENNVSRLEKGRKIKAGIYEGYDLVSTEHELMLDSPSELASERLFTITLTVIKAKDTGSILTFKIFDSEDVYNPLIEKTVINNTLIQTDF